MLHHGLAKGVAQLAAKGLQNGWDVILYWVAHCHVVEGLDDLQGGISIIRILVVIMWRNRTINKVNSVTEYQNGRRSNVHS